MSLCGSSGDRPHAGDWNEEGWRPMELVRAAEESARRYRVQPTSLLIVDIGGVLLRGSFRSEASLFCVTQEITELLARSSGHIHTELINVLPVPLQIILITSQDEVSLKGPFYATDFTQNIRHKFLFCLIVRSISPSPNFVELSALFQLESWCGRRLELKDSYVRGIMGGYFYVPFKQVGLMVLLEPFEVGVWRMILTTKVVIAMAWSIMLRRRGLDIFSGISLSTITVREIDFGSKNSANTMMG